MPNKVKVKAGRYRHRVWVVPPDDANVSRTGEPLERFDPEHADWDYACVEALTGRELMASTQMAAIEEFRVKMRWRDDITDRHQIIWENNAGVKQTLHITRPPIDIETRGIELEIFCTSKSQG
jgi:head-tail adaptor